MRCAALIAFLFLAVPLAVSTASGQRPESPKPDEPPTTKQKEPLRLGPVPANKKVGPQVLDTAFPDLKPPREVKEVKSADGSRKVVIERNAVVPLPPFPGVGADASVLRKLQYEQMREAFEYVGREEEREAIGTLSEDLRESVAVTGEAYRLAAELEDSPAKRVPWYEARVRAYKQLEEGNRLLAFHGRVLPTRQNLVRLERLRAEVELLKLKTEVERAKK